MRDLPDAANSPAPKTTAASAPAETMSTLRWKRSKPTPRRGIFISYRRADTSSASARIYERLAARYGKQHLFMDVDSLPGGVDFALRIQDTISRSAVMLVVIGQHWLESRDDEGRRRIDDPNDSVRREVETAFAAGIAVLPVVVEGAQIPPVEALPPSLQRLLRLNAVIVNNEPDFGSGMRRLIRQVDPLLPPGMRPPVRLRRRVLRSVAILCVAALLVVGLRPLLFRAPLPPTPYHGAGTVDDQLEQVVTDPSGGLWAVGTHDNTDPSQLDAQPVASLILHFQGGEWVTQDTLPRGVVADSVAMVSPTEGWAVGGNGAILHYTASDGWTPVASPTQATLHSVDMETATEGWAVGDSGTILHDSGGRWTSVASPITLSLWSVAMVSASEGWAVGDNGAILQYGAGRWTQVVSPTNLPLRSVAMVSPSEGWAVGGIPGVSQTILHDTAGSWSQAVQSLGHSLQSVAIVAGGEAWAVGQQGSILQYTNGAWNPVASPSDASLFSVAGDSATDVWAVGNQGTLLHHTAAVTWATFSSPTQMPLSSVAMVSPSEGWAVGAGGCLLHYARESWNQVASGASATLSGVAMVSANEGWAVGWSQPPGAPGRTYGTILHYVAGTWRLVTDQVPHGLLAVAMASSREGWAVGSGGTLLHYSAGSWTAVPSPTTRDLNAVVMVSSSEGWAVGGTNYTGSTVGVKPGNGTILHYRAGQWTTVTDSGFDDLYGVAMVSPSEGWAVGEFAAILHYVSASWVSGINFGTTGIVYFYGVAMASPSEGWTVGEHGTLLHGVSGTWSPVASPTGETLYGVAMVSPTEGWAVGDHGTILHLASSAWSLVNGPSVAKG
jgi:photosystem II stability/assembly factor-like uncharacterized protein